MSKSVADQIVEMLVQYNVKRIYAITGDSLNNLNDAVTRDGCIQWVHVRHEEAGAYAAAAEAELEGLACCAGSCGPGHVHLINGLYEANRSRVPVLAIASTINTPQFGVEYFQSTNTYKLFADCSIYNELATTPKQVPRILQSAIQNAIGQRGVAVFGLPGDVSGMDAEESEVTTNHFDVPSVLTPPAPEIDRLAGLLNKAENVCIYCGIGAAEAHDEVVALAGLLQAPVGYSFRAKMAIQYDNPYEVGMTGLLGLPSAFHAMHEADVLLLLGTDFPYVNFMPGKNTIIQIDSHAERLGRRAKVDHGFRGDIRDTLLALLPKIAKKADASFLKAQLEFYKKVQETQTAFVKDRGKDKRISPEFLAAEIDRRAADDAIFTVDTGMSCVWGARFLTATGKRKLLGSFNHGSMANAMPMAIGAALTYPGRQVIAFCGDGGISMLLGDLATIKQYDLPVKLIVFNNRTLGMVKLEMEVAGLLDTQTNMVDPDFAAIALAMGIPGMDVKKPDEVVSSLEKALAMDGPVLLNVFTDPNALAMPPEVEWEQFKGFALSMTKMVLGGRMDEAYATVRSNWKHLKEII